MSDASKTGASWVYVNCWHENDFESTAMWKIYLRDHGVAIQTTAAKLSAVLSTGTVAQFGEHRYMVHLWKVNYIDFEREYIPEGNGFIPLIHKRRSFQHENEVRAMFQYTLSVPAGETPDPDWVQPGGLELPVDLSDFIDAVHVNPEAPQWVHQIVETVCDKFGLKVPVLKSDLDKDAVY